MDQTHHDHLDALSTGDLIDDFISEDGLYFTGSFAASFMSECEAARHFGAEFATVHVDRKVIAHLINERMSDPPFPLGISFEPVSIYEPIEDALTCGQILEHPENLNEQVNVLLEDSEYHEIWSYIHFDAAIVLRHIPTLVTLDGESLFHTKHLWAFADAILREPRNALFFGLVPDRFSPYLQTLIEEVAIEWTLQPSGARSSAA